METGAPRGTRERGTCNPAMKLTRPSVILCMLCDEPIAQGHWVTIAAAGISPPVRCCPECYAMFSDFHIALRLMPSGSGGTFGASAAPRHSDEPVIGEPHFRFEP
jgi:hypothetical protein